MQQRPEFAVGDVVCLISDGRVMTVLDLGKLSTRWMLLCQWTDLRGEQHSWWFRSDQVARQDEKE